MNSGAKAEGCSRSLLLPDWAVGQGLTLTGPTGHGQIHAARFNSHGCQYSHSFIGKDAGLTNKSSLHYKT